MVFARQHAAVETFFKNVACVIATQRAFRNRFGLNQNDSVPDRKTILIFKHRPRILEEFKEAIRE